MEKYGFTLELSRDIIDSEAEIIQSNCSDVTIKAIPSGIGTGYTGTLVEFDREAESLEKAIESAVHDIEAVPDLHATGITIPAPERDERDSAEAGSVDPDAVAEPTGTKSSADAQPDAKTEKRPSTRKAAAKKPSTRKTSTRKATTG